MSGRSFAFLMWFGIAGMTSALAQGPDPALRALELYRHGNCREAEPLLEQVLQRQPKNIAVRKLYASCLMQTGRQEQAKAQYRAILAAAPNDRDAQEALRSSRAVRVETSSADSVRRAAPTPPQAQYGPDFERAEVLIRDKRLPEAESLLERVLARAPQALLPRQRLAEIYTATNRFELAAGAYRVLAAANPTQAMFRLRAAQNLAWAKQYDSAAAEYRTYLEGTPRDAGARLAFANVLMWAGQLSAAADEYREYLDAHPEDANSRISLANVLLWMKRYADAALEFKSAIAALPSESRAHAGLAQCYERMGQPRLALEAYDRALQADPANAEIKGAKTRLLAELPRQKAFVAMERQENLEAAQHFLEYLQQHPESDETVLQIARLYAWGKKYSESITFYNQYLGRKPGDRVALRELAKTELSAADFGNAREHYTLLIRGDDAGPVDYEGLIHAFVWDGKLEEAQPTAQKLAEIEPRNEVAHKAMSEYRDSRKAILMAEARDLASTRRYTGAIQRYREYEQIYGSSAEAELAIARLYSWDKKYSEAESAYHNYLLKHPADTEARLEMANVQRWMGHYDLALRSYNGVLSAEPSNATALLGIAQVADARGADAFALLRSYRRVLAADPKELTAANRVGELIPQTSASMGYGFRSFGDSDGFYRAENRFETSFPFTGHLRLSPYYALDYFHQFRQVGGGNCAVEDPKLDGRAQALSSEICGRNGTYWGSGGGIRAQLGSALGTNLVLDLGLLRFSGGRTYANVRGDLNVHLSATSMLFLQVVRRPAVFDVNTVAAVGAGVMGDTAIAGFQTSLGDRWRLWTAGGFTRYSSGIGRLYGNNMQRRFSAKLDYAVLPGLRAGYVVRASTFDKSSPYYFSPSRYLTYGLSYNWMQPLAGHVRLELDGEGGLGQIKRFGVARLNTLELAVQPAIVWTIYPGLDFRFGYRYSRGRSSSFGSPVYSTGGADFGLVRSLAERYVAPDPARLDIR